MKKSSAKKVKVKIKTPKKTLSTKVKNLIKKTGKKTPKEKSEKSIEGVPMHKLTEEQQMKAVFEIFPDNMKEIVYHHD
jgi:hypothetical protein